MKIILESSIRNSFITHLSSRLVETFFPNHICSVTLSFRVIHNERLIKSTNVLNISSKNLFGSLICDNMHLIFSMMLPALFNLPKSLLQSYGETVYCVAEDMLRRCNKGKTSLERFTSVVAWSISTTRPPIFGLAPFNPVLGETHHVSRGTLNVLLEQVSSMIFAALHATDAEQEVELLWWQELVPRFTGTGIETQIQGKREVKLRSFGESYEMDAPSLVIKFLPVPSSEETRLEADLCYYRSHLFLGFGSSSRAVKGKIFHSKTLMTIYDVYGCWDRQVMLKDVHSGKVTVLYDAKECIFGLKAATVWDPQSASEPRLGGPLRMGATQLAADKDATGATWIPRFFHLERTEEGG
ncbi:unnamed protein product [Spirodela intermedia]|uniref:Uncharacterized protein n=1 Tax=Spirodela intermedia TaxID=51605 RepID=A0ABN7ECP7_SPIIN|nr:unnamed protein product [Spirodela intermedia]